MRKWLRNGLCFLLALTMMLVTISPIGMIEANAQDDTTKVSITGIESITKTSYDLIIMKFQTNHTWSQAGSATDVSKKFKINNADLGFDPNNGIVVESAGSTQLTIQHWNSAQMTNGAIVKIPAGLQFKIGGTTYEIAENYGFTYNGSNGGTKIEPIPLSFTGVDTANTSGTNLSLSTNVDFSAKCGWTTAFGEQFKEDTKFKVNDAEKDAIIYFLGGTGVFLENYLTSTSTNVKISKGTWLSRAGYIFEVTDDFEVRYDGSKWSVYQEPVEPTYTDVTVQGIVLQSKDYVYLNVGLTSGNANYTTESVSVTNGTSGETKITAIALEGGNLFIPWTATKDDILKIAKYGTAVDSNRAVGLKFQNEYLLKYNGTQWETYVAPTPQPPAGNEKVSITGIAAISQNGANLDYLCEMILYTDRSWSGTITATQGQKFGIGDTQYNLYGMTNASWYANKAVCFQQFYSNQMEGKVITIPAGITFTHEGTTYEIKEDFKFHKKDGAWVKYEEPAPKPPAENEKVSITGIAAISQNGANLDHLCEMILYTDRSWSGIITATQGQKFGIGDTQYNLHGMTNASWYANKAVCFQQFYSNQMEGKVITIPAGITFTHEGTTYEIKEDFKFHKKDGAWVKYEEPAPQPPAGPTYTDVTVQGIVLQSKDYVYLNVGLTSGNANYTTESVTVTNGTSGETKITAIALENGNLFIPWTATKDDILKIAKDGTAVDSNRAVGLRFQKEYLLKYNGTQWEVYDAQGPSKPPVEPTYTNVAVQGIVLQTKDFIYLNVGLTSGNANYTTESVTVTNGASGETKITAIALEGGNLFIPWTATKGDMLTIAKGGTAVDSNRAVGLKFQKEYILKYNGTQWETYVDPNASAKYSYEVVNLSGIYVQGGNDLYLTTGIADSHKYKGVSFSTTDMIVYKPNGTTDKVTNIFMHPDSGNLFVAFSYPVEEGLGIRIPKGGIAVNVAKECGIKFGNDFAMFYSDGKWKVDVESPVITYRGEELIAGSLYGLRLGMTQAEVEALFAANDAIQGKQDVVFTYPAGMFGTDGKLQKGTFKMTVSVSDNSGNIAKYTIKVKGYSKDAPTITFKGAAEREFDAGKKFDTSSLKATAKDGNGKKLSVKFSYSKGALDKNGALKKGSHKLYLTATDDEGQTFTRAITLNCYVFTNVKVTGFYYFLNDELYISTNMKDPTPFKGSWMTSDNLLINDKSGAIPWVAVDQNTGSLYIICKKQAGDVMTIAEGATFVDKKNLVGIRVENNFKAHTDGIGWIVDRIPRGRGSGSTGSTGSPTTGDTTPWCGYAGALILAAGVMFVVQKKKKQS